MLVVNAAVAARRAGHEVVIYTSHHDESRCFKETTGEGEGTLHGRVDVDVVVIVIASHIS